jgi:hypothetical protein
MLLSYTRSQGPYRVLELIPANGDSYRTGVPMPGNRPASNMWYNLTICFLYENSHHLHALHIRLQPLPLTCHLN